MFSKLGGGGRGRHDFSKPVFYSHPLTLVHAERPRQRNRKLSPRGHYDSTHIERKLLRSEKATSRCKEMWRNERAKRPQHRGREDGGSTERKPCYLRTRLDNPANATGKPFTARTNTNKLACSPRKLKTFHSRFRMSGHIKNEVPILVHSIFKYY